MKIKVRGKGGLDDEVCVTSRTACAIAVSPVMCSGLLNMGLCQQYRDITIAILVKSVTRYKKYV